MSVFRVDQSVFDLFPNARFAAVVVRGARNTASDPRVDELLSSAVAQVRHEFSGTDPKSHPNIAVWREAFGSRGWTPSKYLSSIEALVRRLAKGGDMPRINAAVDLANSVSLSLVVPIGAHDLDTASHGIVVRLSDSDDRFQPMGDAEEEAPDAGEIVYVHDHDVRTRRWVWRQSRTGLMSENSSNILFPIDGFEPQTAAAVREAAARLASLARDLLGGDVTVHNLDPRNAEVED